MKWDPNEMFSWAWFTKTAKEHGGVEEYINDIEENSYAEGYDDGASSVVALIPVVAAASAGVGAGVKWLYDKYKTRKKEKEMLKLRAEEAKRALIEGYNEIEENTESEL